MVSDVTRDPSSGHGYLEKILYSGFETIPTEQRVPFRERYDLDLNSVMLMEKQPGSITGS